MLKAKIEKKDNLFKAVISINSDGNISGIVYDIENNDEFLPLRFENNQGKFVGEVRAEYENLLENIRYNCFSKKYYIFPQSNRISNLIIQKYGNAPEFLWKTTPGTGIFRNPETKKWYLAILDIDRNKIQKNKKGLVEVVCEIADVSKNDIWVFSNCLEPSDMAEYGEILPDAGKEEEWFEKLPKNLQSKLKDKLLI